MSPKGPKQRSSRSQSFWLVKTEPTTYSIEDLQREGHTRWDRIRNYQARNFLQSMKVGDAVLIYHSNSEEFTGVVGLAEVQREAYPDPTQFERGSDYFDAKASKENPRWFCPDLKFREKFTRPLALQEMRQMVSLREVQLLQRGSRLSVMPISRLEFQTIVKKCRS